MRRPYQRTRPAGAARAQREQQLRLEGNVHQLLCNERAAQHSQALTSRRGGEYPVVHVADELGGDEHAQVEFEARQAAQATEHMIGPVTALERYLVILHEGP